MADAVLGSAVGADDDIHDARSLSVATARTVLTTQRLADRLVEMHTQLAWNAAGAVGLTGVAAGLDQLAQQTRGVGDFEGVEVVKEGV